MKWIFSLILLYLSSPFYGSNQTSFVTYPLSESNLPFRLTMQQASFSLPQGLHTYASAIYEGEWVLLAGRTNGLHSIHNDDPNTNTFLAADQNTTVYVVNPQTGQTASRSLYDSTAGLTQAQIDLLSTTSALFYQAGDTLYLAGGYGINTATGNMETKSALTAIAIPQLIKWVKNSAKSSSASQCIRQIFHPLLQVTGGVLWQTNPHQPYLSVFGQQFVGNYIESSEGTYTMQIRPFQIVDTGARLFVQPYPQSLPTPSYRRRDLNVVPILKKAGHSLTSSFVALAGVFVPTVGADKGGAWTLPVEIEADGSSRMIGNPSDPNTFAQGMNSYLCATIELYSQQSDDMYIALFGGMSYLTYTGGTFSTVATLPFVNDVTTIRRDAQGNYQQYLMSVTFPAITANFGSQPDNDLFFGAGATFFPAANLPLYSNGVIALDQLGSSPLLLGYIVGGIASCLATTTAPTDTQASPYIFAIYLEK